MRPIRRFSISDPFVPAFRRGGRSGTVGTYALHIQCPWRIVSEVRGITGTTDYFVAPHEGTERDYDDPRSGTRQFVQIGALLGQYDETTRSYINVTSHLVVVSVSADIYGGVDILLSGGYRLQVFPAGSLSEDWRFFGIGSDHIVIEAGRVTSISEE